MAHIPDARPRNPTGARRMSSESALTVNIVEPMPPSPRSASRCQYSPANAHAPVVSATMASPQPNAGTSPNRPTTRPLSGANASRDSAKMLITSDAAVMPTSKERTKTGSVGATSP